MNKKDLIVLLAEGHSDVKIIPLDRYKNKVSFGSITKETKRNKPSSEFSYFELIIDISRGEWGYWKEPIMHQNQELGPYFIHSKIGAREFPSDDDYVLGIYNCANIKHLENMVKAAVNQKEG